MNVSLSRGFSFLTLLIIATGMAIAAVGMTYAEEGIAIQMQNGLPIVIDVRGIQTGIPMLADDPLPATPPVPVLLELESAVEARGGDASDLQKAIEEFTEAVQASMGSDTGESAPTEENVAPAATDPMTLSEPEPVVVGTQVLNLPQLDVPLEIERVLDPAGESIEVNADNTQVEVSVPVDAQVSVGSNPAEGTSVLHIEGDNGTMHIEMTDDSSVSVQSETSGNGNASNSVSVEVSD